MVGGYWVLLAGCGPWCTREGEVVYIPSMVGEGIYRVVYTSLLNPGYERFKPVLRPFRVISELKV